MYGNRSFLILGGDCPADIGSLENKGYEILNCSLGLEQGFQRNGKASTRVYAQAIEVVLPQFPTKELLEWGIKSRIYKDGMIVLLDAENIPVEKTIFYNAACRTGLR